MSTEVSVRSYQESLSLPLLTSSRSSGTPRQEGCSREGRRQAGSMLAVSGSSVTGGSDRLPLVQPRPFTNREWRPSRSLPSRSPTSFSLAESNTERRSVPDLQGHRGEAQLTHRGDLHSHRGDLNSHRGDLHSYRVDSHGYQATPRADDHQVSPQDLRPCTHPRMRCMPQPQPLHDQAFVWAPQREKSTIADIRGFQGEQSAPCDPPRETDMRIYGQGMRMAQSLDHHHDNTCHNKDTVDGGGDRLNEMHRVYLDDAIYDAFDRSKTLPSIRVGRARLKKRRGTHGASGLVTPGYQLGVANTLDLLSQQGKRLGVEEQLCQELKHTLHHLRRTKEGVILTGTFRPPPKTDIGSPTAGEMMLRLGSYHNTSQPSSRTSHKQKRRPGLSRSHTFTGRSDAHDSGFESNGDMTSHPAHHSSALTDPSAAGYLRACELKSRLRAPLTTPREADITARRQHKQSRGVTFMSSDGDQVARGNGGRLEGWESHNDHDEVDAPEPSLETTRDVNSGNTSSNADVRANTPKHDVVIPDSHEVISPTRDVITKSPTSTDDEIAESNQATATPPGGDPDHESGQMREDAVEVMSKSTVFITENGDDETGCLDEPPVTMGDNVTRGNDDNPDCIQHEEDNDNTSQSRERTGHIISGNTLDDVAENDEDSDGEHGDYDVDDTHNVTSHKPEGEDTVEREDLIEPSF